MANGKQKYKLGKMTTTKIRKLAESGIPEAKKYLETRGLTTSESLHKAKMAKLDPKAMKMFKEAARKIDKSKLGEFKKYVPPKAKTATKVFKKAAAKKTIGKAIAKKIPLVGAAIIAHDVIKGVSKATCGKRGGKWVSGKCQGAKKTKFKPGAKVKDPISKR